MKKQLIILGLIISILTSIFSVGGAWAIMRIRVDDNTEKIEINSDCIDVINDDKSNLTENINEIKYNMKAICKALDIEYITLNGD